MDGNSGRSLAPALAAIPLGCLLLLVAFVAGLAMAVGESGGCSRMAKSNGGGVHGDVPTDLIPIYTRAATRYGLGPKGPAMLASINFNETAFGTNTTTSESGAVGWMMFMPATWDAYGVDANGDGRKDPYSPADAIFAAAHYLRASGAPGNWHNAIFAYNHAEWYVERILGDFKRFGGAGLESTGAGIAEGGCGPAFGGEALLRHAQRLFQPRAFKALPSRLWVGEGAPQAVDQRIWADAVWLLDTYGLRVRAARESGHETHGDGTAMDMVPASGRGWDETALRAAEDLGWTPSCGYSGAAPVCPLVPAIEFIGYNGYDSAHGDPDHSESPHLHVSWKSSIYGCSGLCEPREWVMAFPLR